MDKLTKIAAKQARKMPQLALAWILNNPSVTAAICSATSIKQLAEALLDKTTGYFEFADVLVGQCEVTYSNRQQADQQNHGTA